MTVDDSLSLTLPLRSLFISTHPNNTNNRITAVAATEAVALMKTCEELMTKRNSNVSKHTMQTYNQEECDECYGILTK